MPKGHGHVKFHQNSMFNCPIFTVQRTYHKREAENLKAGFCPLVKCMRFCRITPFWPEVLVNYR